MSFPEFICVLDFEATCDNVIKHFDNEIIEFPSVLLKFNGTNYENVSEFQKFCRPLFKPIITNFCNELTGITQEQVDNGGNFIDVLNEHHNWLQEQTAGNVIILTCGFWDLGIVMISECKKWAITPPELYLKFVNIKNVFLKFYKHNKSLGMAGMLNYLAIPLDGRHHSGIDDCRNIAKILKHMVTNGCVLDESDVIKINVDLYKINHPDRKKEKKRTELRQQRLAETAVKNDPL